MTKCWRWSMRNRRGWSGMSRRKGGRPGRRSRTEERGSTKCNSFSTLSFGTISSSRMNPKIPEIKGLRWKWKTKSRRRAIYY